MINNLIYNIEDEVLNDESFKLSAYDYLTCENIFFNQITQLINFEAILISIKENKNLIKESKYNITHNIQKENTDKQIIELIIHTQKNIFAILNYLDKENLIDKNKILDKLQQKYSFINFNYEISFITFAYMGCYNLFQHLSINNKTLNNIAITLKRLPQEIKFLIIATDFYKKQRKKNISNKFIISSINQILKVLPVLSLEEQQQIIEDTKIIFNKFVLDKKENQTFLSVIQPEILKNNDFLKTYVEKIEIYQKLDNLTIEKSPSIIKI